MSVVCSHGHCEPSMMFNPARLFMKSGALTPAAHTIKSASASFPSPYRKPPASAEVTAVEVGTRKPMFSSRCWLDAEISGGKAGSIRGPLSRRVRLSLSLMVVSP
jgi:hypothetical protein